MVEPVCRTREILKNCGYVLRAVFPTEVLGAGIYSSVIFGGSMVLANAVGGMAAVAIGQSRTEQNTRAVVTLDKDARRETREGLGQHGVPGPVVPRGEQRAGRPSGRRMVLCGRGGTYRHYHRSRRGESTPGTPGDVIQHRGYRE
jgi:hypothetical protein